ncbi:MAG: Fic/DOC family N-terminal domain-containing protein [Methanomicrobium sp.]|nr:Fic/DOC family N-terminal domain-containing protein [Methanomicrobium sp.]
MKENSGYIYESRAGIPVRQKGGYLAFVPKPLPPTPPLKIDGTLKNHLKEAEIALARLEGAAFTLPDTDIFIRLFIRKEALLSTQIEGTQASLKGVFVSEAGAETGENPDDLREVINYILATEQGIVQLEDIQTPAYLQSIHRTLIEGTRGKNKRPGFFRDVQNYIGRPGSTINEAAFIPPPPEMISGLLNSLMEFFISDSPEIPHLIKAALIHVQFETIHPFMDGNGRLGRLLIVLYLCYHRIIINPVLILSLYLKEHQEEYYQLLNNVRYEGEWEEFCIFFLKGVSEVSKRALLAIKRIHILKQDTIRHLSENSVESPSAVGMVDLLFKKPVFTTNDVISYLDINKQSAYDLIKIFEDLKIITEITGKKRYKKYLFSDYLTVIE